MSIRLMDQLFLDKSFYAVVEIIRPARDRLLFLCDPHQLLPLNSIAEKAQFPVGLDDFCKPIPGLRLQNPNLKPFRGENVLRLSLRYINPYRDAHYDEYKDTNGAESFHQGPPATQRKTGDIFIL